MTRQKIVSLVTLILVMAAGSRLIFYPWEPFPLIRQLAGGIAVAWSVIGILVILKPDLFKTTRRKQKALLVLLIVPMAGGGISIFYPWEIFTLAGMLGGSIVVVLGVILIIRILKPDLFKRFKR